MLNGGCGFAKPCVALVLSTDDHINRGVEATAGAVFKLGLSLITATPVTIFAVFHARTTFLWRSAGAIFLIWVSLLFMTLRFVQRCGGTPLFRNPDSFSFWARFSLRMVWDSLALIGVLVPLLLIEKRLSTMMASSQHQMHLGTLRWMRVTFVMLYFSQSLLFWGRMPHWGQPVFAL